MSYREQSLGVTVRFLLPSLKLKMPCNGFDTMEQQLHSFLVTRYEGYTATAANLFGYWKESDGGYTYGEHREFTVALHDEVGLPELKQFLGIVARDMGESCLYVEVAGRAMLLYGH